MNELEFLKNIYLEDLGTMVQYGNSPARPKVRHIQKWNDIQSVIKDKTINVLEDQTRRVFVWSDIHFGHKNIISFCNRPYGDVTMMNKCLELNFNENVGPNDISIWVGDVTFMSNAFTNEILDRLNGYKILIIGNHDFNRKKKLRKLNFDEVHLLKHLNIDGIDLVFTHYPMDNLPHPYINIHGHIHDNILDSLQHINVSVEVPYMNYKPILLTELHRMAKTRLESMEKNDE